jgi:hypothetical protein
MAVSHKSRLQALLSEAQENKVDKVCRNPLEEEGLEGVDVDILRNVTVRVPQPTRNWIQVAQLARIFEHFSIANASRLVDGCVKNGYI